MGVTDFDFEGLPLRAATGPWNQFSRLDHVEWGTGGVYVLIGRHDGKPALRPGESHDVRDRLKQHAVKPPLEQIERFVAFKRTGRGFNSAEYGHLEGLLHTLADEVDCDFPGRRDTDETLTPAQQEDLKVLFQHMLKLLVMLGIQLTADPPAADPYAGYDLADAEPLPEDREPPAPVTVERGSGPPAVPQDELLFRYNGFGGTDSVTHLRIFRPPGCRPLVVAGALADNPGTSITNAAEFLAAQVVGSFPELENAVFVEFWPRSLIGDMVYHRLEFERADDDGTLRFYDPSWVRISEDDLRELSRGSFEPLDLDDGRYDQAWVGERLSRPDR